MILSQRLTRYSSPERFERQRVKQFETNVPYLVWHAVRGGLSDSGIGLGRIGGSLPRSLTAPRLRQILQLTQSQIDRLTLSLNRRVAQVWRAAGYDDWEFYRSLAGFIGTPEGLAGYQEAACEVENEVPGWRLTIDGAIFRGIRKRFVVDANFIAIFPYGVAAEIEPRDVEAILRFLVVGKHWEELAEFAWATAVRREGEAEIVLGRFDQTKARFAETIAALQVGGVLEVSRRRVAGPDLDIHDAATWIDGLAVLLELIDRLFGEIREQLKGVATASRSDDLEAVRRHTDAIQATRTDLEGEVGVLMTHLAA